MLTKRRALLACYLDDPLPPVRVPPLVPVDLLQVLRVEHVDDAAAAPGALVQRGHVGAEQVDLGGNLAIIFYTYDNLYFYSTISRSPV